MRQWLVFKESLRVSALDKLRQFQFPAVPHSVPAIGNTNEPEKAVCSFTEQLFVSSRNKIKKLDQYIRILFKLLDYSESNLSFSAGQDPFHATVFQKRVDWNLPHFTPFQNHSESDSRNCLFKNYFLCVMRTGLRHGSCVNILWNSLNMNRLLRYELIIHSNLYACLNFGFLRHDQL